jgi:hypothetical protein
MPRGHRDEPLPAAAIARHSLSRQRTGSVASWVVRSTRTGDSTCASGLDGDRESGHGQEVEAEAGRRRLSWRSELATVPRHGRHVRLPGSGDISLPKSEQVLLLFWEQSRSVKLPDGGRRWPDRLSDLHPAIACGVPKRQAVRPTCMQMTRATSSTASSQRLLFSRGFDFFYVAFSLVSSRKT